ncbi:PucR family transcriptional regulator [Bacillus sp. JJ1474]|uniref:PucR family transcriptional regulator n=1 Tax=Bacillus sp. JJ1474 TaxID=3122955 RepID=UPI002FFFFD56
MLSMESLENLCLIAGHRGLNKTIKSVSVLEIPNKFDQFVAGGEFILTTFHSLSNNYEGQVETIKKFSDFGVAALGIHPMITGPQINVKLINAANTYGLPLILLPPSMNYSTVFSTVLGTILNYQSQILKRSEEINRELTKVILQGGDVKKIALTLSELIKKPILIINDTFDILAIGSNSPDDEDFLQKCLQVEGIINNGNFSHLKNSIRKHHHERDYYTGQLEIEGESFHQVSVPAGAKSNPFGYIFTWELKETLRELDFIALSHAATALALEIAKQRAVTETEDRLRSDFLTELFNDKFFNEEELYNKGQLVGLNLAKKHMVLVAKLSQEGDEHSNNKGDFIIEKHIRSRIRPKIELLCPHTICLIKGNSIILLIHFDKNPEVQFARDKANKISFLLKEELDFEFKEMKVSIGIGNYYASPLGLGKSHRDAIRSINIGERMYGTNKITAIYELGIYEIIEQLPNYILEDFTSDFLAQLNQYDNKHQLDLVKTVELYLDVNESFTETGKMLFVHPNTVKYRIEKIKEILGFNPFKEPEQKLNFHLALKAQKLL